MALPARREIFSKLALLGGLAAIGTATPAAAQAPGKRFVKREAAERSGYSQAVVTQGGRTIWLAGHTGAVDASGKSLAGDIDAQVRAVFAALAATLAEAGGKLSDMVTMTVFLSDARHTTRMTELRTELFGKDFPASAAITVQGFAQPEMMIEVQGIAVAA